MKSSMLTLLLCAFALSVSAQRADYRIIPQPQDVQTDTTRTFVLQDGMHLAFDATNAEVARTAQFLSQWVAAQTGVRLQLTPADGKAPVRLLLTSPAPRKGRKPRNQQTTPPTPQQLEAYTLEVGADGVVLQAQQPIGLFRAAQTLRKALPVLPASAASQTTSPQVELPYAHIADQPRFAYRGVLLDCARHFFSVDFIKQYLDVMALHGCNQFHWHFTDDQGWRFEVKSLPRLAQEGSVRPQTVIGPNSGIYDGQPHGGYYTQEECRELVRYAAERYINIVPEIDLPGHMQGALHVFPELGCTGGPYPVRTHWGVSRDVLCGGNPETMTFLRTVLGELCDIFPSEYIHIGGDECPKDRWRQCAKCQAKIRELGLADDGTHNPEEQLQTWINREVEHFLNERGRSLIGWDEILAGGLTEGAIVMSWRGIKGGIEAARQHHRVIMSPNVFAYIDHPQLKDVAKQPRTIGGYIVSASKIYSFEPVVPEELSEQEQDYILGVQANLWTEYVAYPEHAFYQLLPRLAAMCEVQWCRPAQKDFADFSRRLPRMQQLYDRIGVPYCHQIE